VLKNTENTSSMATVDINRMQQNPMLKLVTQIEMNAQHNERQPDQVFKMSSTSLRACVVCETKFEMAAAAI